MTPGPRNSACAPLISHDCLVSGDSVLSSNGHVSRHGTGQAIRHLMISQFGPERRALSGPELRQGPIRPADFLG
jgi:hypothetical protein